MKKWKRLLAIMLCIFCVQVPVVTMPQTAMAAETAVKQGLKREGSKYYYYVNGVKVTNTWKTVSYTSNGKTVSYRYYFGANGAAYAGRKYNGVNMPIVKKIGNYYYAFNIYGRMLKNTFATVYVERNGKVYEYKYYLRSNGTAYVGTKDIWGQTVPTVRKIGNYYYGFDLYGRVIKGTYVIKNQFYYFISDGRMNVSRTRNLRLASKQGTDAAAIRKLLGNPKKVETSPSCYAGGDGIDERLYYNGFTVSLFKYNDGREIVLGVSNV